MEVRFESMVCLWDDAIPKMFLEFVNLLTLATSEEQLRRSVKDFAEKHELDKFFCYGFGSHHFYMQTLHERPRNGDAEQSAVSAFLTYKQNGILTNEREKRNRYYKHIVKRHLNDIREHIGLSTNEMERSYYNTRYAVQLSIYAEALGIQEKYLERFIQK